MGADMVSLSSIATHRDAPPTYSWLFVYGTLMPGHGNYPIIQPAVIHAVTDARVPGMIGYPSASYRGYPVAALHDPKRIPSYTCGWVHGALLLVDVDDDAFTACNRMEQGAGYGLIPVTAVWNDEPVAALAWTYKDFIYDVIPEGRWQ